MPDQGEPHPEWAPGILFKPTWDIGWQYDYIARSFLMRRVAMAADMGLGKSVMALGVAGACFEQQVVDLVLIVCEKNKLSEWTADVARFTRLSAALYDGPKAKREKILGAPLPHVLVATYETSRNDAAVFPPKKSRSRTLAPGPLLTALAGLRVLVVYDEVTKIGHGRGSNLYRAHEYLERQLRRGHKDGVRVLGLTGTPMETDYEGVFNEMRVIVPDAMPKIGEFEERVIRSRDPWGRPSYNPEGVAWFRERCDPHILRKRKSDPDVRDSFPPVTEEFRPLLMNDDQYRLYRSLEDLAWDADGARQQVPGLAVLLRLLAGDPLAVLEAASRGSSQLAVVMAEELGEELRRCSSAKAQELTATADVLLAGGGKMMAFTLYAETVLPALRKRLGDRTVFTYTGSMTQAERDRQLALFKGCGEGAVLLLSDAGSKGINVPEADVIVEYEPASKHSTRVQRAARGHRLGRQNPLTFITFLLESTIENTSSLNSVLARNADQDFLLHDDEDPDYVTAEDRREWYAQARPRKAVAV
jgi:superfamily II DNA or RNA helicase